jgi:hypothetical protein
MLLNFVSVIKYHKNQSKNSVCMPLGWYLSQSSHHVHTWQIIETKPSHHAWAQLTYTDLTILQTQIFVPFCLPYASDFTFVLPIKRLSRGWNNTIIIATTTYRITPSLSIEPPSASYSCLYAPQHVIHVLRIKIISQNLPVQLMLK